MIIGCRKSSIGLKLFFILLLNLQVSWTHKYLVQLTCRFKKKWKYNFEWLAHYAEFSAAKNTSTPYLKSLKLFLTLYFRVLNRRVSLTCVKSSLKQSILTNNHLTGPVTYKVTAGHQRAHSNYCKYLHYSVNSITFYIPHTFMFTNICMSLDRSQRWTFLDKIFDFLTILTTSAVSLHAIFRRQLWIDFFR